MKYFKALSGKSRPEPDDTSARAEESTLVPRTAALIAAELETAQEVANAIATKLGVAETDLESARRIFDTGMHEYAVGHAGQPDESALADAVSKLDSLRRVDQIQQRKIAELRGKLAAAQQREAAASNADLVAALIADAQAKYELWERAASEMRTAESELFQALFGGAALKCDFTTPELNQQARTARFRIRDRVLATAKKLGVHISDDFKTDGNPNLGSPQRQAEFVVIDCQVEAHRDNEIREAQIQRDKNTPRFDLFAWMEGKIK